MVLTTTMTLHPVLLTSKLAKAAMSIATATIPMMTMMMIRMEELIWERYFQAFLVTMERTSIPGTQVVGLLQLIVA